MSALLAVPWKRFVRASRAWLALAFWVAVAVVPALLERFRSVGHGADHALLGFYASIALPFVAYSVLSAVLGRDGLGASGIAVANFGASPGRVALHTVTVAVVASAILGGGLGCLVDLIGHGPLDPPLVEDALRALAAGAMGGAAYAAFFAAGSSFGARGWGRSVLLVIDWLFGTSAGTSALLVPRAHVRNLLGGVAPLEVSGRTSYLVLAAMIALFTGLACARASRARWNPAAAGRD
jgi:hypothetical protein